MQAVAGFFRKFLDTVTLAKKSADPAHAQRKKGSRSLDSGLGLGDEDTDDVSVVEQVARTPCNNDIADRERGEHLKIPAHRLKNSLDEGTHCGAGSPEDGQQTPSPTGCHGNGDGVFVLVPTCRKVPVLSFIASPDDHVVRTSSDLCDGPRTSDSRCDSWSCADGSDVEGELAQAAPETVLCGTAVEPDCGVAAVTRSVLGGTAVEPDCGVAAVTRGVVGGTAVEPDCGVAAVTRGVVGGTAVEPDCGVAAVTRGVVGGTAVESDCGVAAVPRGVESWRARHSLTDTEDWSDKETAGLVANVDNALLPAEAEASLCDGRNVLSKLSLCSPQQPPEEFYAAPQSPQSPGAERHVFLTPPSSPVDPALGSRTADFQGEVHGLASVQLQHTALGTSQDGVDTSQGGFDTFTDSIDTSRGGVDTFTGGIDTSQGGVDTFTGGVDTSQDGVDTSEDGVDTFADGVDTFADGVDTFTNSVDTSQDGVDTFTDGVDTFTDSIDTSQDSVDTFTDGIDTSQNGVDTFTDGVDTFTGGVDTFTDGVDTFTDGVDTSQDGIDTPQDGIDTFTKPKVVLGIVSQEKVTFSDSGEEFVTSQTYVQGKVTVSDIDGGVSLVNDKSKLGEKVTFPDRGDSVTSVINQLYPEAKSTCSGSDENTKNEFNPTSLQEKGKVPTTIDKARPQTKPTEFPGKPDQETASQGRASILLQSENVAESRDHVSSQADTPSVTHPPVQVQSSTAHPPVEAPSPSPQACPFTFLEAATKQSVCTPPPSGPVDHSPDQSVPTCTNLVNNVNTARLKQQGGQTVERLEHLNLEKTWLHPISKRHGNNEQSHTSCSTGPNNEQSHTTCPNNEQSHTSCSTGPNNEQSHTTCPNNEQSHTSCSTGPNNEQSHTSCSTGPNNEQSHTNCSTGPNNEQSHTNCSTGPNNEQSHTNCSTGPNNEQSHTNGSTAPPQNQPVLSPVLFGRPTTHACNNDRSPPSTDLSIPACPSPDSDVTSVSGEDSLTESAERPAECPSVGQFYTLTMQDWPHSDSDGQSEESPVAGRRSHSGGPHADDLKNPPEGLVGQADQVGPACPQGHVGLACPQGHVGPACPQGEVGPACPQGHVGLACPQGQIGPACPQGQIGPACRQGQVGPACPQGHVGLACPQGQIGPACPQGEGGGIGDGNDDGGDSDSDSSCSDCSCSSCNSSSSNGDSDDSSEEEFINIIKNARFRILPVIYEAEDESSHVSDREGEEGEGEECEFLEEEARFYTALESGTIGRSSRADRFREYLISTKTARAAASADTDRPDGGGGSALVSGAEPDPLVTCLTSAETSTARCCLDLVSRTAETQLQDRDRRSLVHNTDTDDRLDLTYHNTDTDDRLDLTYHNTDTDDRLDLTYHNTDTDDRLDLTYHNTDTDDRLDLTYHNTDTDDRLDLTYHNTDSDGCPAFSKPARSEYQVVLSLLTRAGLPRALCAHCPLVSLKDMLRTRLANLGLIPGARLTSEAGHFLLAAAFSDLITRLDKTEARAGLWEASFWEVHHFLAGRPSCCP
ncbi:hypothetical protein EGW08_017899 [Elysia chlorotica]|uniref:Uncharacterized protein n=1 Tax=Elysia chlorotica TaxID=188477 RepID=A0A433SYG9_ELYCH|nr:hypothetical protein EGW08_017899 [Elysia chlorotica]